MIRYPKGVQPCRKVTNIVQTILASQGFYGTAGCWSPGFSLSYTAPAPPQMPRARPVVPHVLRYSLKAVLQRTFQTDRGIA